MESDRGIRDLSARLQDRSAELERATMARVYGVSDPAAVEDPEYRAGLRSAVSAALDYGISGISGRAERPPQIPAELPAQARLAARAGVPLETVLRRYFAGHALLGHFILATVEESALALSAAQLRRIWNAEVALFDRLVARVAAEYGEEEGSRHLSAERRRAELVRRLLDGELLDPGELRYELDAWHLGAVAHGPGAAAALRGLAAALGRSLLAVRPEGETVWGWLGGRERLESAEAVRRAGEDWPGEISIAFGEPGRGVEGWRLSHRQAQAAHPIVALGARETVRYRDVALLATAMADEVLAKSLRDAYLAPLAQSVSGGEDLRRTLRAYFAAGRNVTSTAASLGVTRQTVNRRLRAVEEAIGQPLDICVAEIGTALDLEDLHG